MSAPLAKLLLFSTCALILLGPGDARAAFTVALNGTEVDVTGSNAKDKVVLRVDALTHTFLEVDLQANGSADQAFPLADITAIVVTGNGGDDEIAIDDTNGNLASESVVLNGGPGRDTLIGGSGSQVIIGGDGDDFVDAGPGNDTLFLGAGDDVAVWSPGDGSDIIEGQDGDDLLEFNGSAGSEIFDVSANGGRVLILRNVGNIVMDLDDVEQLDLATLGGVDTASVHDLSGTDLERVNLDLAIAGGGGDSAADSVTVFGSAGADVLSVGVTKGVVEVAGLQPVVRVLNAEAANDSVACAIGAGDRVQLLGTSKPDVIGIAAAPSPGLRASVAGFPAAIDVLGGGRLDVFGLGGGDTITVTPPVAALPVSLQIDGGSGNDSIEGGDGDDLILGGPGNDSLHGNAGNDSLQGGPGNDELLGGLGSDVLIGDTGVDHAEGGPGNDVLLMGSGSDTAVWRPGDGSDIIEGQDGSDSLEFQMSNGAESVDIAANGGRVRLFRNVGNITMDLNDVEKLRLPVLGGADTIVVNDLTGTDVKEVSVDLEGVAGSGVGDGLVDAVVVNGTAGPDSMRVSAGGFGVLVTRKGGNVRIAHSEPTDTLTLNGLAGVDKILVGPKVPPKIAVTVNPD